MAGIQKHLHELLKEDQEPFHLNNYIADRQCQVKKLNSCKPKLLPIQKRNPATVVVESSPIVMSKKFNLCRHACFLSFQASPDVIQSPFPSFLSPAKSPCSRKQNSPVFLDAALKIQKPKSQIKKLGLGLFSSILKKLKDRKRSRNMEIGNSRKNEVKKEEFLDARRISDVANFGSLSNTSMLSSAGWSEKETSTISSFGYNEDSEEEFDFEAELSASDFFCENSFCSSPYSSPFRFSLQKSPSSAVCTPVFSSPAASPSRRKEQIKQKKENLSLNSLGEFSIQEKDEKEQSSPVSVLDPPFEIEDDEHESLDEEDFDVQCSSSAILQRSKKQLLSKQCRFDKLAELDPMKLEQRLLDDYDEDDEENVKLAPTHGIFNIDPDVDEVLRKSDISRHMKVLRDMKRLISDLIAEEERDDREIMVKRVCRKLDCWKEVESNTIDMMVEMDLRNEVVNQWKVCEEQREETGIEIEVAILGILVEELTQDMVLKLEHMKDSS